MDKVQLVEGLKQHLSDTGMSQNKLASKVGISSSYISQMLSGNFENMSDKVWKILATHLGMNTGWQIFETSNYRAVHELCEHVMEDGRMRAIYGLTGTGKTTAAKEYAKKRPNAYYILCNALMNQGDFVRALENVLGVEGTGSINKRILNCAQVLASRPNCLLILDDAGKLKTSSLYRIIQVIYDETEGLSGIVLMGTEKLKQIIDDRAHRNEMGYRELKSRIAHWHELKPPKPREIEHFYQANGLKVEQDARPLLVKNTHSFRDIRNRIASFLRYSKGDSISIDLQLFNQLSC